MNAVIQKLSIKEGPWVLFKKRPAGACNKVVTKTPLPNGEMTLHACQTPDKIRYRFYSNRGDAHDNERRGERHGLMFPLGTMVNSVKEYWPVPTMKARFLAPQGVLLTALHNVLNTPSLLGLRNLMTSTLLEKHTAMDTHTPDNWDNLTVDVPQPLRGRYVTNPLTQAMRLELSLDRRLTGPLTAIPTAGTLLPAKLLPPSSSTEKYPMISPIAPKKALNSLDTGSVAPLNVPSNAVQQFQTMDELSPVGLMWQLVKDAMGIRSQAQSAFQVPLQTLPAPDVPEPVYRIPPFRVRLQQRLQQAKASSAPVSGENPFALLPLQWTSAPPLQRAVCQETQPL